VVSDVIFGGVTRVHSGAGSGKFSRMVENSKVKGAQASPCWVQLSCIPHLVESLEAPQCVSLIVSPPR
jgi:hypothetical protein